MAERYFDDEIARFLHDAGSRLHGLSVERRHRILAEAEYHLRERAAELVGMGRTPGEAASEAVEAFGAARSWSGEMADTAEAARKTPLAQGVALGSLAWMVLVPVALPIPGFLRLSFQSNEQYALPAIGLGCIGIVAGSAFARRYLPTPILKAALAMLASIFLFYGWLGYQMRQTVDVENASNYHWAQVELNSSTRRLREGMDTYASGQWRISVPADLMSGSRYIVPANYDQAMSPQNLNRRISNSAAIFGPQELQVVFAEPPLTNDWSESAAEGYGPTKPFYTAATASQASAIWRAEGPKWLNQGVPYATAQNQERRLESEAANKPRFATDFAANVAEDGAGLLIFGVILHLAATIFARLVAGCRWRRGEVQHG